MGKLLWEAINRSTTGPIMDEDKFETELFPNVMAEVQAKYKIEWDPEEPIMADPDMADAVFQAGMELLCEVGLYNTNTKRIVKFTQEEIQETICTAKREVTLGCGREAIHLKPRGPGDPQRVYTFFPAGAIGKDVELYRKQAMSVVMEPTCDGVIPIPLFGVGDIKIVADTPAQTLTCLTEARIMNEVATWAGRPGLFLGIPMSATTPITLMSAFGSGLYHKGNCCLPVQILQDMRIDFDRFNLVFFAQQHGIEPWMSCSPTLYAYLTGPEQGAIESIAHTLGMMAYSGGSMAQSMSVSVHGTYHGNEITWCNSAAALAADRNLGIPWLSFGSKGDPFGALNDETWYANAIAGITGCISGMEGLWLAGGVTGVECRFSGEIARAAAGLSPEEGIRIIKDIGKRENDGPPPILPFDKLYDPQTLRPCQELTDQYRKMTKSMRELGLDDPAWH